MRATTLAFLMLIPACDEDISVSLSYDPKSPTKVNGTLRAKGASRSKTVTYEGTLDANGCLTIETEECGTQRICGGRGAVRVTITCEDPALIQVPAGWSATHGDWLNSLDGTDGDLLIYGSGDFQDPLGNITVDAGHEAVLLMADTAFPSGFDGEVNLTIDPGSDDPDGVEIKMFEVYVAQFYDEDDVEIGGPEVLLPDGVDALDFRTSSDLTVAIEPETDTAADSGGDGDDTTCGCSSGAAGASGLLTMSLAALALGARRRGPTQGRAAR